MFKVIILEKLFRDGLRFSNRNTSRAITTTWNISERSDKRNTAEIKRIKKLTSVQIWSFSWTWNCNGHSTAQERYCSSIRPILDTRWELELPLLSDFDVFYLTQSTSKWNSWQICGRMANNSARTEAGFRYRVRLLKLETKLVSSILMHWVWFGGS